MKKELITRMNEIEKIMNEEDISKATENENDQIDYFIYELTNIVDEWEEREIINEDMEDEYEEFTAYWSDLYYLIYEISGRE